MIKRCAISRTVFVPRSSKLKDVNIMKEKFLNILDKLKFVIIILAIIALALFLFYKANSLNMNFAESGIFVGKSSSETKTIQDNKELSDSDRLKLLDSLELSSSAMSDDEFEDIKKMLHGKFLYKSPVPSCSFSKELSITFNGGEHIFYIASDSCGIIYYKNEEKYFNLTEKENIRLRKLLEAHDIYCHTAS